MLRNLLVGTLSVLGLIKVPLRNVLLRDSSLTEQVHGAGAASAQSAEHKGCWLAPENLLTGDEVFADLLDELFLVQVVAATLSEGAHGRELLTGVSQLPRPVLETKCGTSKARVKPKSRNSNTILLTEKLQVVKGRATAREAAQDILPAALVLVAVGKGAKKSAQSIN